LEVADWEGTLNVAEPVTAGAPEESVETPEEEALIPDPESGMEPVGTPVPETGMDASDAEERGAVGSSGMDPEGSGTVGSVPVGAEL
jgi:hypothetical protein